MFSVSQLLERIRDLPPDTPVCIAELEEAFANNVASIEVIPQANIQRNEADAGEAVDLEHGRDTVVVLRW